MINATTTSNAAGSVSSSPQNVLESASTLTSDFETFLKMLTAQAKYQDPLEPLDSAEYASQLAQFSSVEQSVQTNQLLEHIVAQLDTHEFANLASWIGKEVQSSGDLWFDGTPIKLNDPAIDGHSDGSLIVHSSTGLEIQRLEVSSLGDDVTWNGLLDSGAVAEAGYYNFSIEYTDATGSQVTQPIYNYASVTEIEINGAEASLVLSNKSVLGIDEIRSVRQSQ